MTNGTDCAATPSLLCAVQSLMQQALLKGRSKHPIAPAVPARFRASVPIIPTHVLDRSLNDANQVAYLVICRKVVFAGRRNGVVARDKRIACARPPTPVILNLFQDPFIRSSSGPAARWTLKQVQGDEVGGWQPYTGAHPIKKARTISGPGHELDVRGRNIGRGRGVKGEERTPRRQIVKLNNCKPARHAQ